MSGYELNKRQVKKLNKMKGCGFNEDMPAILALYDDRAVAIQLFTMVKLTLAEAFKL